MQKRLIANADVTSYTENKGMISMELPIQNLLEENEEYLLVIQLESGDRMIYYYTRIIESQNSYVSECIDFVRQFNDTTFDSEKAASLSTYMEKTTGDNTTLQYVTLNNSLNQVSWAEFHGTRLTTPVPSVKEITPTYNVIVLDYVVTRVGQNGQSEYYNVEEYYRVRYTNTRMYLLNFERTMEEIFRGKMTASQETASCLESARRMWSIRPMNPAKWSLLCRRENSGVTIRRQTHLQKCSVSGDMKG